MKRPAQMAAINRRSTTRVGPTLERHDSSDNGALSSREWRDSPAQPETEVGLLTGGFDRPYVFGLATALVSKGVHLDVIGGDEVDHPELHAHPKLNFLNLRGSQQARVSIREKAARVLIYYAKLIRYAAIAKPKILHIVWNNRFQFFDRTLLMLYYKLLGKKIVLTAHNINANRRDSKDTLLNRLTLKAQYRLADHIFVHTEKMKNELSADFGIRETAITVIPFGVNNSVPNTSLTTAEAKRRLGIGDGEKTILFFGRIGPYKGLKSLVTAFQQITKRSTDYRLIIAGRPKKGAEEYLEGILKTISGDRNGERVITKIEYIPDEETELYFKAADVLALPYTQIYQSGVLFLAYSFGLPAIATNVGSFDADIIEGRTGFLCKPGDPADLARAIEMYFASDLYQQLDRRRQDIRDYGNKRHSWDSVAELTRNIYAAFLRRRPS